MIQSHMNIATFCKDRIVYWPEKFDHVVKFLQLGDGDEDNSDRFFELNAHVVAFAACVGVITNSRAEPADKKKEIALSTFLTNDLGVFLYLIPMLDGESPNVELLRDEHGEDQLFRIFEEYIAGGFEFISNEFDKSGIKSPYSFVRDLILKIDKMRGGEGDPDYPDIEEVPIDLE